MLQKAGQAFEDLGEECIQEYMSTADPEKPDPRI
jgi:hypothetical protein